MWKLREDEPYVNTEDLFIAGQRAPAGVYKQVGGDRVVHLDTEDWLPASLDGRVACYMRLKSRAPAPPD